MKIIKIFRENGETIELTDNDSLNRSEYIQQLQNIFKSSNIVILETSSASIILKPHKIDSILVVDVEFSKNVAEDFIQG